MNEEEEGSGPALFIKKRSSKSRPKDSKPKPAAGTTTSTTEAAGQDEDDDAPSAVVRRNPKSKSSLSGARQSSKLSFGGTPKEEAPKKSISSIKPSSTLPAVSLADAEAEQDAAPSYSAQDLESLKASTLHRTASNHNGSAAAAAGDDLTKSKFGHLPSAYQDQATQMQDDEALIPTDNAISAAKMKRDMLRKSGASAQDFIALDENQETASTGEVVQAGDKGGESRLMREDDELGEGDEEMAEYTGAQDRIALSSKARRAAETTKRAGIQDLLDEAQDDFGLDDEEMRRWEDAQIRRSGHDHVAPQVTTKEYRPAPIPTSTAVPSFNMAMSRLQATLDAAQLSQESNRNLADQSSHLKSLETQESDLRLQVESTSRRFEFFSAFQSYVEDDLVPFLDAKMPLLEKLEKRNAEIQTERKHILAHRRMTAHACELAGWTRRPVLNDYHALRKEEQQQHQQDDMEIMQPQTFVSPMEAAPVAVTLSEQEMSDLQAASQALEMEQSSLLADVQAEEFRDPVKGPAAQFKRWREAFPEEYKLSYAGLVLVQAWEFWARLELSRWNPYQLPDLAPSTSSLEQLESHAALVHYAHETGEEENLFGALTADVIVPRLQDLAPAYDPFDATSTSRVLSLVEEVTYGVEREGRKFEMLVSAFLHQIQLVIYVVQSQVLALLPLPPKPGSTSIGQDVLALLEHSMRWRRFAKEVRFQAGGPGHGVGAGLRLEEALAQELLAKVLLPLLRATGDAESAKKALSVFGRSFALSGQLAEELRQI